MQRLLGSFSGLIYSAARLIFGLMFMQHGLQKVFGLLRPEDAAPRAFDLFSRIGWAGIIEFFGGGLIALGLFTTPVAFIASGEMAFAYFLAHAPRGPWPILNGGELAVLYCFMFLYIASQGPGRWSVDAFRGRR